METWTLVSKLVNKLVSKLVNKFIWMAKNSAIIVLVSTVVSLNPILSETVKADKKRQEIRLYKVNKDGITQRLRFTKRKSKRLGCKNLILKSRVFKISQFGYKHCVVFNKKNCEEGTEMLFTHSSFDEPQIELTQGYGWQPKGEHARGERMKSWMCLAASEQQE